MSIKPVLDEVDGVLTAFDVDCFGSLAASVAAFYVKLLCNVVPSLNNLSRVSDSSAVQVPIQLVVTPHSLQGALSN